MGRIPVYRRVGDVYIKVREADELDFEWLKDEPGMEIVEVYIDEVEEEDYPREERRVYEFRAET